MKFSLPSTTLFLLLVATMLPIRGQDSVSLKIDVVAWGDPISGLSFKSGKKNGEITAEAFTYSEPVNYSGPQLMEIHQSGRGEVEQVKGPGTPEDADHESKPLIIEESVNKATAPKTPLAKELAKRREEDPSLVALIQLPTNTRRATVLLSPAGDGTYVGYVIDDDPSKLPSGKLRVHNLSQMRIAMKFSGGQQQELKPGSSFIANAQNGQSLYQLSYLSGQEWKVQENNIIPVRTSEQTQLIVLRSQNQFFLTADGASGGFLQVVILRRESQSVPAQ